MPSKKKKKNFRPLGLYFIPFMEFFAQFSFINKGKNCKSDNRWRSFLRIVSDFTEKNAIVCWRTF
jgi:hypothetical protein